MKAARRADADSVNSCILQHGIKIGIRLDGVLRSEFLRKGNIGIRYTDQCSIFQMCNGIGVKASDGSAAEYTKAYNSVRHDSSVQSCIFYGSPSFLHSASKSTWLP